MQCEAGCINCGDELGAHHLCLDCLEGLDKGAYRRGYADGQSEATK